MIAAGSDIPHVAFREVQVVLVKLIIQCQQSSCSTFPIPYLSADCRRALYRALLNCLLTNSPGVPPPVHHAARLFSLGLQDIDFKVSSYCQEALAVVNTIIHPRIFPQVCSAPGPLQLSISEQHASTTEMASCITSEYVLNTSWHSLGGESDSNDGNHADRVQTNVIPMEQEEFGAKGETMDNSFVISVGNQTVQGSKQNVTSENQSDKSCASERESQVNCGKDKSLSDAGNVDSQISTQTQNNESSQIVLLETLPSEDFGPSPQYARVSEPKRKTDADNCNSKERIQTLCDEDFVPSPQYARIFEPKRRKADADNCNSSEGIHVTNNNSTSPTENKDQPKESVAISDNTSLNEGNENDETAQMLATFVDSYPDSDEQEFS